ncbi:MAG: hypothetical protein KGH79_05120 [Patescibacteria group bacterium]|nr:hypothetical protein [Patescibacteria group bacterium]
MDRSAYLRIISNDKKEVPAAKKPEPLPPEPGTLAYFTHVYGYEAGSKLYVEELLWNTPHSH